MHTFLAFCQSLGWPGLALLAFSAATLLPLGSEWLLAAQLLGAHTTGERLFLVAMATLANTAGGMVTYGMGRAGVAAAKREPAAARPRLAAWVRRYGPVSGALGWAPFIGDAVVLLAGVFRVHTGAFLAWSLLGRAARYAALWWMV